MNILLLSPQTPDTFWSFSHIMPLLGKKAAFPPLGLLTVAAMLPRDWHLRLIDLNVSPLSDADLAWADAVFLSAMIVQEPSAREVIDRANAMGVPVVAGGPLFTTGSERFPEVASCVIGEAEDIIASLVADLAEGSLQARYEAPERPDISKTPLPRWDLINVHDYATLSVQFSRGCPFDCEFCDITAVYGRVPRVKSPGQMIQELEAVLATGWRGSVFIVDDNFIGNKKRAKALLRAMIQWRSEQRVSMTFTTEASMNLVDDSELLGLMVRAGFKYVFVGIESPQEASLTECNKVQNTKRDLISAVRTIQHSGIEVMGGFIVGFDSDTENIFEQQRTFIQEAGVVTAMVGMLTALPGTRLFTRLTAEGRMIRQSTGNNLDAVLNFTPCLDRDNLTEGYRRLVTDLYQPRTYYRRIQTFLQQYRPQSTAGTLQREDLLAFLRGTWILGVRQSGRWAFWRLLGYTILAHRRAFPHTMELAIRGIHFRAVAARI